MTNYPTLDPVASLARGYANPGPDATARADRRRRDLAATYRPDERLDALLVLRDHDPAAFARIADPTITITLGSYAVAKAAFEEVQRDDS